MALSTWASSSMATCVNGLHVVWSSPVRALRCNKTHPSFSNCVTRISPTAICGRIGSFGTSASTVSADVSEINRLYALEDSGSSVNRQDVMIGDNKGTGSDGGGSCTAVDDLDAMRILEDARAAHGGHLDSRGLASLMKQVGFNIFLYSHQAERSPSEAPSSC